MHEREIIHLNVADFAVAVERVVDSRLRDRPVLIAPEGALRAAVFDMSDEAYRQGVRKGMALQRAKRLCKDALVVPPHADRYERAMQEVLQRTLPYSPLIEMTDTNGHLFIDTTGTNRLFGPAYDVAWRIRKTLRRDLGFDPIWSVAPNKLVAKIATRTVKPTGEYILEAGQEEEFLKPLSVHLLPGLERDDLIQLRDFQLGRVGQLRDWSLPQLETAFARRARFLYDSARGIDSSPVLPVGQKQPKVMGEHEFGDDVNDVERIEAALYALVEKIGFELRERRLAAGRLGLVLDYSDGVRMIRQATAAPASANDFRLFSVAKLALERAWTRRVRVRHLRLIADRLGFPPAQLDLFAHMDETDETNERLISAIDTIRKKFGAEAVRMGRSVLAQTP